MSSTNESWTYHVAFRAARLAGRAVGEFNRAIRKRDRRAIGIAAVKLAAVVAISGLVGWLALLVLSALLLGYLVLGPGGAAESDESDESESCFNCGYSFHGFTCIGCGRDSRTGLKNFSGYDDE